MMPKNISGDEAEVRDVEDVHVPGSIKILIGTDTQHVVILTLTICATSAIYISFHVTGC